MVNQDDEDSEIKEVFERVHTTKKPLNEMASRADEDDDDGDEAIATKKNVTASDDETDELIASTATNKRGTGRGSRGGARGTRARGGRGSRGGRGAKASVIDEDDIVKSAKKNKSKVIKLKTSQKKFKLMF